MKKYLKLTFIVKVNSIRGKFIAQLMQFKRKCSKKFKFNQIKKVYAILIDLKTAFDCLDKEEFLRILRKSLLKMRIIERILEIYRETLSVMKTNNKESEKL